MLDHAGVSLPAAREAPWDLPATAAPDAGPPVFRGLGSGQELFLLPGGSVALCDRDGIHLCDPLDWLALPAEGARGLRGDLARSLYPALAHCPDGVSALTGLPDAALAQSASLVPSGTRLPRAPRCWARLETPALALWTPCGAVLWRYAPAPPPLGLAVALLGRVLRPRAAPIAARPAAPVARQVSLCRSAGLDPEALAQALAAIPGVFAEDHAIPSGHALAPHAVQAVLRAQPGRALLFGAGLNTRTVARLASARGPDMRALEGGGWSIVPPAGPAELYALAWRVSAAAGQPVLAAAPAWGFCQRVDAAGLDEAGNASWFGMGAGLDELAELVG
jgi:hypothetical protein